MVRKTLLSLTLIGTFVIPDIGFAQAGNYNLTGVYNVYHYLVRDLDNSVGDSLDGTYQVKAHWPNAYNSLFDWTLVNYEVGDTIGPVIVPLPTPAHLLGGLSAGPIGINVDLYETGTMVITGTYPAVTTADCSTAATVPAVTDNATWQSAGDPIVVNNDSVKSAMFGWGFVESGVFANNMYAPDLNTEVYGADYGDGTDNETWGRWTSHYNDDFSQIQTVDMHWEQVDGVSSGAGVDTDGNFNGHFGVTGAFGDSSTTTALHAVNPAINVGTYPIIGGSGADLDGDSIPDGVVASPKLEWGYIFDPSGDDGVLFSADEPLQFTGYYMTFNFLSAASALATAYGQFSDPAILVDTDGDGVPDTHPFIVYYIQLGLDQASALVATADSLANLGMQGLCVALGQSALAPVLGPVVGDYAGATLTTLLTGGVGTVDALTQTGAATGVYALGALAGAGVNVNDSDHDYDGTNGRLVFQVGNVCIPRNQHLEVNAYWVNTAAGVDVDPDESMIPKKFALYDNFPNPFNPTTQIAVDLPEAASTKITVWNIMGQKVATLHSGDLSAGHHVVNFDGRDQNGKQLTSGMYFYRVKAGKYNAIKKMTLLK